MVNKNNAIIREIVKTRDYYEEQVLFGLFVEGVIAFVMLMLIIMTMFFSSKLFGSIMIIALIGTYSMVTKKRLDRMARIKRIKEFVKECKNDK